jgi:hypothetical protein
MKKESNNRKADEMDKDCNNPMNRRERKSIDTFILNA